MQTRLDRYRAYMDRLDAAASPHHALERNLYVAPPFRSLAGELALRLTLTPSSTHLVLGGIGSGKTTQLLVAERGVSQLQDTTAIYVDVSTQHDLSRIREGVLVTLAGLHLAKLCVDADSPATKSARRAFHNWAHGYSEWVQEPPDHDYDDNPDYDPSYDWEPGYVVNHKGLLSPPLPPLSQPMLEKAQQVRVLMAALPALKPHAVVLFDSLDRLSSADEFRKAVQNDIRALKSAGLGTVVVGPSRVLYGTNRSATDLFDHLYLQPTLDARTAEAEQYLIQVLRKRADESILPLPAIRAVVAQSGGVMRDLIAIARRSGEEAYLSGSDNITIADVARAADGFGRAMMLGLRSNELLSLQNLRNKGTFVPTSDDELALLETRRVLDYGGESHPRYAVHPTINPLLASLPTQQ